ncbi:MAG: iron/manganese transporter, partial [Chitinophagaceae bacterium]
HEVAEIQDAHRLLENIFGSVAPALFAIALIAAGQSSTITGTLAGQIVMEGHLNLRIQPWLRRLLTRMLAIVPAFFTILYFGEDALGGLLVLSQVVLSLQLGFAIIPLIHFTSDKKEMKEYAIKLWVKVLAWLSALVIISLNVKLVVEEISGWSNSMSSLILFAVIIPLALGVGLLLLYVFLYPMLAVKRESSSNVPHGKAIEILEIEKIAYDRIVVAVDFSKNDKNTIRHALIQGGKSATYYLVHVVETAAARYHGDAAYDLETKSDAQNLQQYTKDLADLGYTALPMISYGNTASGIAEVANKNNAELLVMGAHGHRVLKDLIFGTTVNAVRHKVKIPVLIVR